MVKKFPSVKDSALKNPDERGIFLENQPGKIKFRPHRRRMADED